MKTATVAPVRIPKDSTFMPDPFVVGDVKELGVENGTFEQHLADWVNPSERNSPVHGQKLRIKAGRTDLCVSLSFMAVPTYQAVRRHASRFGPSSLSCGDCLFGD
jgi:hypothetical protein